MVEVWANVTVIIILQNKYQINTLYTLDFQDVIYQLYLNKAGGKKAPPPACLLTVAMFSRPKPGARLINLHLTSLIDPITLI